LLVLLLVSAFFSIRSQQESNENTVLLEQSNAVLLEIESVTATINEAESAQRGYLATGLPSFLSPFYGTYRKTLGKLFLLQRMLGGDKVQRGRLDRLSGLVRQRFLLLYKGIGAKDNLKVLLREREVKNSISSVIAALRDTERRKLVLLDRNASESRKRTVSLTLLFSLLGISIGGFFLLRINREMLGRVKAELQLKLKKHRLEQYTRELEQIAYISAHDLKEPLRSIASYSELMVKYAGDSDKERLEAYSSVLIAKVKRMSEIIDALQDFISITSNGTEFVTVSTQAALDNVQRRYGEVIRQTQAVIKGDRLPAVKGIPVQVEQLFENLIDNAIKFRRSSESPVIEIQVKETDQMWQFSVKDNGIGIEDKYFHKLFRVFNTLHPEKYQGTGIGLAKCKKIVECHEGTIWLESRPEEGATVTFTLPKA
jgi:signal transduction histidine kinase